MMLGFLDLKSDLFLLFHEGSEGLVGGGDAPNFRYFSKQIVLEPTSSLSCSSFLTSLPLLVLLHVLRQHLPKHRGLCHFAFPPRVCPPLNTGPNLPLENHLSSHMRFR